MKLLRKGIKCQPKINPNYALWRAESLGWGLQPVPGATHYMSEVELGAACRYRFW